MKWPRKLGGGVHSDLVAILELDHPLLRREFLERYREILNEALKPLWKEMETYIRIRDVCKELEDEYKANGKENEFNFNRELLMGLTARIVIGLMNPEPEPE